MVTEFIEMVCLVEVWHEFDAAQDDSRKAHGSNRLKSKFPADCVAEFGEFWRQTRGEVVARTQSIAER